MTSAMTLPSSKSETSPAKSGNTLDVSIPQRRSSLRSIYDLMSVASSFLSREESLETYRQFTEDSWERLLLREQEDLRRQMDRKDKPSEGKLVDGEIKFDTDENDDENIERDPELVEGNVLPESRLGEFPDELLGKPIEEIDKYIKEKTFVVINTRMRKKHIFRFSATKAFFFLSPWNRFRKFMIMIATNQFFDYLIMLTILANTVFLTLPDEYEPAELTFLAIYTVEMFVKMLARGFCLNPFTYLRDPWNWLDLIIVLASYITIVIEKTATNNTNFNVSVLRAFRVFRVLKTISIFPGLRTIISALFNSFRMLIDVIILMLFCMSVFSLFALQIYMGVLRNKCVKNIDWSTVDLGVENTTSINAYWNAWMKNSSNWLLEGDGEYWTCGNASGAGKCESIAPNYTCHGGIGNNPKWGYVNYDDFPWSLLSLFQLITLDFWEYQYNLIIRASGPWNVLFFLCVVFFGSFYLINLMLAVVAMSYEEEAMVNNKLMKKFIRKMKDGQEKEMEQREAAAKKKKKKAAKKKKNDNYNLDVNKQKKKKKKKEKVLGSKVSLHSVGSRSSLRKGGKSKKEKEKGKENKEAENAAATSNGAANKEKSDKTQEKKKEKAGGDKNVKIKIDEKKEEQNGKVVKSKKPLTRKDTCETLTSQATSNSSPGDSGLGSQENIDVDDDEETPPSDEPVVVYVGEEELLDRNCPCCGQCCKCWIPWLRIQNKVYTIVTDPLFDVFIMFCILVNTAMMASEHYPSDPKFDEALKYSNYIFTAIFTLECILKLCSMSKEYFQSGWNIFDLIVVLASLVDTTVEQIDALSMFRIFRLFRVFKLAQSWKTMRMLLTIIFSAISAVGNLTFILLIVVFIFAVIGKTLFKGSYTTAVFGDDKPRWHFDDIGHALLIEFRILCGEWIEPLWDCMRAKGILCMVVFIPTLIIGNLMVLNLFLALLLNSFGSDTLKKETDEEESKLKQVAERIKGLFRCCQNKVSAEGGDVEASGENRSAKEGEDQPAATSDAKPDDQDSARGSSDGSRPTSKSTPQKETNKNKKTTEEASKSGGKSTQSKDSVDSSVVSVQPKSSEDVPKKLSRRQSEILHAQEEEERRKQQEEEDELVVVENCCLDACFCECCHPNGKCECCYCCMCDINTPGGQRWFNLRDTMLKITEHKAFEAIILLIILGSSITLTFEDIYLDEKPQLKTILTWLNMAFAILFCIEMLMKWIALGFKVYFSRFWTILDFCIVVVSLIDLIISAIFPDIDQLSAFKAIRTLRAFRPLRTISRLEGMKIVVNALVYAIPSIVNVLLVCVFFWLIFAIMGVQFFKGKFYKCVDADDTRVDYTIVPNMTECLRLNYTWKNSKVNFDNTYTAYLALFQVATFEGWMEIMRDAIDARSTIGLQPIREISIGYYAYFVTFIIVGSFFTLNLFIGVIIDNFNTLKKQYEGNYLSMFLTASQKNYYNTMKKLGNKKPQKTIKRPKNTVQGFIFDVAISNKFELTIVILIFLNMVVMMVEHYKQPQSVTLALEIINIIFTTIFTMEALIKIIGLRWHYFRRVWNVFDFIIVILSIIEIGLSIVLNDMLKDIFVTPTLLRVVRIFRIGRVLRLIKAAKGIRKLLFALIISLPALFNVVALLTLITFIFSIIGMSLFGNLKHTGAINDLVNFETFERSIVLLVRLTTSAGWNDILEPMMITEPDCNSTHITRNGVTKAVSSGDCGIPWFAALYMLIFVFITFLIVINTYIAIILENFNQAHEQEEVGITDDDFDMFYVVWERYDPHASQYIKYEQLSDFVAELDEPLGIPKPNVIALVSFDLPITEGDKLHCLDILIALVRHVLGDVEESSEFQELKQQMESKYRDAFPTRVCTTIISTTMRRKKEDIAAKLLQRAWRRHKAQRAFRQVTENAMMMAGKSATGSSGPAAIPGGAQLAAGPGAMAFGSNASLRTKKTTPGEKMKPLPGGTALYKAS